MKFERKKTIRGFQYISFQDGNGHKCSIQDSSLATDYCLWLGIDNVEPIKALDGTVYYWGRMHLTQAHAKKLIKHLQKFVDTGGL